MANINKIQFLRNSTLFGTRAAAIEGLQAKSGDTADGVAVLARYSTSNGVKTLVGINYNSGEAKSMTIFDVEGASADVQALRTEINAKLGDGVTSANTATEQLAALSGNNESTSGETSVEGAKRYADDKIAETVNGLDYAGVTTGDAVVVTNVTETDGIVSATSANVGSLKLTDYTKGSDSGAVASTDSINQAIAKLENQIDAEEDARAAAIDALDYTDTAVTKQFIAKVDETNGVVSVERGEIESSGKTIVLTADGNDVNFEVNIDGVTLEKDANGVISVTSSALVQYEGDDDTIQISAVDGGVRTVSSPLTIQKVTTGLSEEVKEEYHLVGHSGNTIGDPVKIYKDSHIVSITYITEGEHAQNLEYVYIDASGNTQTTYVDMSELVLEAEFASGVTVTDHIAHGVVDGTSETFLTVGADGFKLSGVQGAIDTAVGTAVSGLDATVTGATSGSHITISIEETDGKLIQSGLTIEENDIASASDLAELSGKTVTALTSTNNSISASIDDAVGNKTYDIQTDASKIKMTGFTAAESGLTAITSASTVTEAVKAIETEMIANEQTTSSALNDLDGRLDTVEGNYVSGITVNGNAVTVSNNVAPISITKVADTTNYTNPITLATDANGSITIGFDDFLDCGVY